MGIADVIRAVTAFAVTSSFLASVVLVYLHGVTTPLEVTAPLMLAQAGYAFGLHIVKSNGAPPSG